MARAGPEPLSRGLQHARGPRFSLLSMMFCSRVWGSWATAWSRYRSSLLMLDTGMPKDCTNSSSCCGSRSCRAERGAGSWSPHPAPRPSPPGSPWACRPCSLWLLPSGPRSPGVVAGSPTACPPHTSQTQPTVHPTASQAAPPPPRCPLAAGGPVLLLRRDTPSHSSSSTSTEDPSLSPRSLSCGTVCPSLPACEGPAGRARAMWHSPRAPGRPQAQREP